MLIQADHEVSVRSGSSIHTNRENGRTLPRSERGAGVNQKHKIISLVAAVGVLATIIIFSINARRKESIMVQSGKVERTELLVSKVSASGEIKPKEYVELQAEIAGGILELYVKEGDVVSKGDLLLKIDPTQKETETRAQKASLESAQAEATNQKAQISLQETNLRRDQANVRVMEAELLRAQKDLELARGTFDRKQQLYEDNLISREMYETAKNTIVGAEATLAAAHARLEQAEAQLAVAEVVLEQAGTSYKGALSRVERGRALLSQNRDLLSKTIIRSPLTGVITKMNVEVGERAVPGTLNNPAATLMIIADLSVIEAEIEVDETDIVHTKLGQKAEVKVNALPDNPLSGTVTEIGNSAITRTGQQQEAKDFKVVIQLDDPPATLRPGLSCTAEITTASHRNVLIIPIQALTIREYEIDDQGIMIKPDPLARRKKGRKNNPGDEPGVAKPKKKEFQGVFVISDGKAEFVTVEPGIMGDTEIELTSGVQEGTDIVTGTYKTLRTLKEGNQVKIEKKKER